MTKIVEPRERTASRLLHAHEAAGEPTIASFHEHLHRGELERAADVLARFGDQVGDLPRAFWDRLKWSYENMGLEHEARICVFRIDEVEHGFIEAQLSLTPSESGGRARPIFTDYRPNWNIGNRTSAGEMELHCAPLTVEDARSIAPGGSGRVRLHPLAPAAWAHVRPGSVLAMHEGARSLGRALVLRVTLRDGQRTKTT